MKQPPVLHAVARLLSPELHVSPWCKAGLWRRHIPSPGLDGRLLYGLVDDDVLGDSGPLRFAALFYERQVNAVVSGNTQQSLVRAGSG